MTTDDQCAQPTATLALAFAVGSLIGAAYVTARAIYWPYRMHVLRRP